MVKTITVNENVYANNDNEANALRNKLKECLQEAWI